jgi:hypothetical protein
VVHQDGQLVWTGAHLGARTAKVFQTADLQERASVKWSGLHVLGTNNGPITQPTEPSGARYQPSLLTGVRWAPRNHIQRHGPCGQMPHIDGYQGNRSWSFRPGESRGRVTESLRRRALLTRRFNGGLIRRSSLWQTRIPEEESRKLLVTGFLEGVLERIPEEEIRQRVQLAVEAKMKTMEAGQIQKADSIRTQSAPDGTGAKS